MTYDTKRLSVTLGFAACALFVGSQHFVYGQTEGSNAGALKGQMKVLEAVINETLGETFKAPFGVLEKAKGSYLPDFGVVFSLEVDLYPVRAPAPLDFRPLTKDEIEKSRKVRRERITLIKQAIPRLLADHASTLRAVSQDESIAVVVHLFYVQLEGDNLPSQVVMELKKRDLEQYWNRKLSFEDLRSKVRTFEL